MTQAIFVNLLNTQLAAAASTTSTTLTLSSSANLPTLASGQFFPLWLQDAATGQVHELVYVTGVSGATLTVERAQEGTSAQNWNIGDLAYSNGSSGTFAPITAVHSPVVSETLPTANKMVVLPGTLTADIALTLPASPVVGQEYTIFGSDADYTVTVQTGVTSGSPYIGLPDGSTVHSWVIPAGANLSGIVCTWDGLNWRARTFGATVVSDASANNEAVALGQLTNGSISPTFGTTVVANASASNEAVNLGQAFILLTPTSSETITPTSLTTVVSVAGNTSDITITLNAGTVEGQKVRIYSGVGVYTVTVASSVTSGSPAFIMPDASSVYSFQLPGGYGAFVEGVWDGNNWRCVTGGPTVVADATANNEAVALGQLTNGSISPTFSNITASTQTLTGNQTVDGSQTVTGTSSFAAGTSGNEGVNYTQLTNGSISPTFGTTVVNPGTSGNEAVTFSQLGNLNGVIPSISSGTTLPNTAFGQAFQVVNGVTVTLPASNGNAGELLYFFGESGNFSIANNTGQFIYAPPLGMTDTSNTTAGATTLTVTNGGTAVLMSRGDGEFDVIGGSVMSLSQLTNGSISPTFGTTVVSNATSSNEAVNLGQLFIGNRKAVFTSNGTYTVPDAVTTIWVSGCAGGGGGGAGVSGTSGGNGGSAGQSVIKTPLSVSPGNSLSITIGGGGAGGAGGGNNPGGNGGNSTVVNSTTSTTLLTLNGGSGGDAGGAGSTTENASNSPNSQGYPAGGTGWIISAYSSGGAGGSTPFGGGGGSVIGTFVGISASGFGAGGGGGAANGGGSGAPGIIIIEW